MQAAYLKLSPNLYARHLEEIARNKFQHSNSLICEAFLTYISISIIFQHVNTYSLCSSLPTYPNSVKTFDKPFRSLLLIFNFESSRKGGRHAL